MGSKSKLEHLRGTQADALLMYSEELSQLPCYKQSSQAMWYPKGKDETHNGTGLPRNATDCAGLLHVTTHFAATEL